MLGVRSFLCRAVFLSRLQCSFVMLLDICAILVFISSTYIYMLLLYIDTHEVVLTSGDMLFYESSKCFHGRPRTFRGSWYTSVFVHYYPTFYWNKGMEWMDEKLYAVPPHWDTPASTSYEHPLEVRGTTFTEPSCQPHDWCNSYHSIQWSGPGQEGYWIAPTGQKYPLTNPDQPLECKDWDSRCPIWSTWNNGTECQRNLSYMLSHCKKSCHACAKDRRPDTTRT